MDYNLQKYIKQNKILFVEQGKGHITMRPQSYHLKPN